MGGGPRPMDLDDASDKVLSARVRESLNDETGLEGPASAMNRMVLAVTLRQSCFGA
jgi:hypothetical protein